MAILRRGWDWRALLVFVLLAFSGVFVAAYRAHPATALGMWWPAHLGGIFLCLRYWTMSRAEQILLWSTLVSPWVMSNGITGEPTRILMLIVHLGLVGSFVGIVSSPRRKLRQARWPR